MIHRRTTLAAALAVAATVGLTACSTSEETPSAATTPPSATTEATPSPTFDEAAAEAEIKATYTRFQKATNELDYMGYKQQETYLLPFMTKEYQKGVLDYLIDIRKAEEITRDAPILTYEKKSITPTEAQYYVCQDWSKANFVKRETKEPLPLNPNSKGELLVTFQHDNSYGWLIANEVEDKKNPNMTKVCK